MEDETKKTVPGTDGSQQPATPKAVEYDRRGQLGILAIVALLLFGIFSFVMDKLRTYRDSGNPEEMVTERAEPETGAFTDTLVIKSQENTEAVLEE